MKSRVRILMAVVLLATLLAPLPGQADNQPEFAASVAVEAAGRGNPWINLRDGTALRTTYDDPRAAVQALAQGQAQPLSLAAADFDEDGVPDLVAGYAGPDGGGLLALYRGNVDSVYPHSPEAQARRDAGMFTEEAFLTPARVFEAPAAPDFLATGDFDNDGHWDVVLAARDEAMLTLLPGDGQGGFGAAGALPLPGGVTALAAGETHLRDGLTDLAVGIDGPGSPQVLIFAGLDGALQRAPEVIPAPARVTGLAIGALDERPGRDVAAAAGSELLIIHGRDNWSISGAPAALDREQHAFPTALVDLAIGDFVPEAQSQAQLAVLAGDGIVHLWDPWTGADAMQLDLFPTGVVEGARLTRTNLSSLPGDDVVVLAPDGRRIRIVTPVTRGASPDENGVWTTTLEPWSTALDTAGAPVAALPMRLNPDALSDLVLLQSGANGPVVVETAPMSTFTVNDNRQFFGCNQDADPGDGICATYVDGTCTLHAAIDEANASPGAHQIVFALGGGTPAISCPYDTYRADETVTILGNTGGATRVVLDSIELVLRGDSNTLRELVVKRSWSVSIRFGEGDYPSDGNLVEGCYVGTDAAGSDPQGADAGIVVFGSNNTIGGTAAAAGNLISASGIGIGVSHDSSDNTIAGNTIGTDVTGNAALGNNYGIYLVGGPGVADNTIGGTTEQARNLISGNHQEGIWNGGLGTLVAYNWIGVNRAGTAALGNGTGMLVGASAMVRNNVISGNGQDGLFMSTIGSVIQGNAIGTDPTGTARLGNSRHGILGSTSGQNVIGALPTGLGEGNLIAYNGGHGIVLSVVNPDPYLGGDRISRNHFYDNGGLGIDLVAPPGNQNGDGPTANDPNDTDQGPNRLQNWPEILAVAIQGDQVQVTFRVDTQPAYALYPLEIEFYSADSSGAEGQTYLGGVSYQEGEAQTTVTKTFTLEPPVPLVGGAQRAATLALIVATATDADGNTSEFSQPVYPNQVVVNTTGDGIDPDPGDGLCWTGGYTGSGQKECTLRAAIETANARAGSDAITFAIPGAGVPTIRPQSALPPLQEAVALDGASQPGGKVELDGSQAGAGSHGLYLSANDSIVRGLVVNRFGGHGIVVAGDGNTLFGNTIGADVTGAVKAANGGSGIYVNNGANNIIGGAWTGAGNLISGNVGHGVWISGAARENRVEGNYIGTDAAGHSGAAYLGNDAGGILVEGDWNTIGLGDENAGNVISGNGGHGVEIRGEHGQNNAVIGNYIGVYLEESPEIWVNRGHGVLLLNARDNIIAHNVIGYNKSWGVAIEGAGATGNRLEDNYVGIHQYASRSNHLGGVLINGAAGNIVGGSGPDPLNWISSNGGPGVLVQGAAATANRIEGNFIGTNFTGDAPMGNEGPGVEVVKASDVQIVGNLISGNESHGVSISCQDDTFDHDNRVQGNYIGTPADGSAVLGMGNGRDGVRITCRGNRVGGSDAGQDNVIAGNFGVGIRIDRDRNWVQGNYIGLSADGDAALSNSIGVFVQGYGSVIGGAEPSAGNVIADGIALEGTYHRVQGNYIGTNAAGTAALPTSAGETGVSIRGEFIKVSGNLISGWGKGIHLLNGAELNQILQNRIGTDMAGTAAIPNGTGVWLAYGARFNLLRLNHIAYNCTNVIDEGYHSGIWQNTIVQGACNTGVLCDGCSAQIAGNWIADDQEGDGIRCENGGEPVVHDNNLQGNLGFGLRNLDPSVTVSAQDNWWGAADGPGGAGPGSGDEVSTYVDYAPWRTEPAALLVFPESDPVYAARGATVANPLHVQNWAHPTDTITVTLTDALGWLVPPATFTLTMTDGLGASALVSVTVPAGAPLGTTDLVTVTAVSHADPGLSDTATFQVVAALVADLAVVKEGQGLATPGQPFTYAITVTNAGPDPATGVVLTDTLPITLTFLSAQASQGSCAAQDGVVVCPLGALANGGLATVVVTVVPAASGEVANVVEVAAGEPDPARYDNVAIEYTMVGHRVYLPLVLRNAP